LRLILRDLTKHHNSGVRFQVSVVSGTLLPRSLAPLLPVPCSLSSCSLSS
jgi:hypothetical protein